MQKRLTTVSKLLLVFLALIFIIYPMGKLNAREINSQEINFYDGFIELYPFYSGEELKVEKIFRVCVPIVVENEFLMTVV